MAATPMIAELFSKLHYRAIKKGHLPGSKEYRSYVYGTLAREVKRQRWHQGNWRSKSESSQPLKDARSARRD